VRFIECDLHAVGVLEARYLVAPGCRNRRMDQGGPMLLESAGGCFQVGHLQRKPDPAGDSASNFNAVDRAGLLFVEDFKRSPSHVENERPSLIFRPYLGRFESQTFSIESRQKVERLGRQRDPKFDDRWILFCGCHQIVSTSELWKWNACCGGDSSGLTASS
jgi:hypothetical protein